MVLARPGGIAMSVVKCFICTTRQPDFKTGGPRLIRTNKTVKTLRIKWAD